MIRVHWSRLLWSRGSTRGVRKTISQALLVLALCSAGRAFADSANGAAAIYLDDFGCLHVIEFRGPEIPAPAKSRGLVLWQQGEFERCEFFADPRSWSSALHGGETRREKSGDLRLSPSRSAGASGGVGVGAGSILLTQRLD